MKILNINQKIYLICLFSLIFLFVIFNSNIFGLEKLWIKDFYDPYNPKTEASILSRIKNGWYPAGFNFDGLDFSMIWINKSIANKLEIPIRFNIKDFMIVTIPDSEEGLNKILPQKLQGRFFPISISYYAGDFFIFAIEPLEKYKLESYIISHFHKSEENKIAVNINELIKKGYFPLGFSFYLDYYIFLSIRIKDIKPSGNFYWGIDWVANEKTNIDKYYNSLFNNFFYPSDFSEDTERMGVLVLHK